MPEYIDKLPQFVETLRAMMDIILTNVVLIGQIPAPTFNETARVDLFLERLAQFHVDECTTDGYRNPIGIIRGTARDKPPIFVVARMDTPFGKDLDHHFSIRQNRVSGVGLLDNSLGVGVLLSLPEIFTQLGVRFESDIVLAGVIQSIGKGNLLGMRHLLKNWSTPIRGAVCIESGELGRLNYYSDGMIRCDIVCHVDRALERHQRNKSNAILVLNEVINQILELRLPLKPYTQIIPGTISGGLKHGQIALDAVLGLEIHSDSDEMVKSLYTDIRDIVAGLGHPYEVGLKLKTISNLSAARLKYNHPLVKSVAAIMRKLDLQPVSEPSESELSILLALGIPAVTLGVTHGEGYQLQEATMQIEPMFKGIAQIVGTLMAIDSGVCDDLSMD